MGETTNIAWCHHTFNPWEGCREVSPACTDCYARRWVEEVMGISAWGNSPRKRTTTPWKNIYRWNRAAQRAGETRRVFLGSLMDIFEEHPQLGPWRADVWKVLREVTSLTFLLLTKRPENIARMLPADLQGAPHLWLGTTVESQDYLHRLDSLCDVPAVVHFVSAEPQLEAIDFRPWFATDRFVGGPVNWIITGGESKQKKDAVPRPYDLAWPLDLIDQGVQHGVPVFVKQLGSRPIGTTDWQRRACQAIRHRKGENPDEWPPELQVRQFPQPSGQLVLSPQH